MGGCFCRKARRRREGGFFYWLGLAGESRLGRRGKGPDWGRGSGVVRLPGGQKRGSQRKGGEAGNEGGAAHGGGDDHAQGPGVGPEEAGDGLGVQKCENEENIA